MSQLAAEPATRRPDPVGPAVWTGRVLSGPAVAFLLFSHALFGVYLGAMMWGGLWLRNPVLRSVFPLQAPRD